jgi:hypothetical protein
MATTVPSDIEEEFLGSPIKRHPLKGTCQEKKVFHKQEEAFF